MAECWGPIAPHQLAKREKELDTTLVLLLLLMMIMIRYDYSSLLFFRPVPFRSVPFRCFASFPARRRIAASQSAPGAEPARTTAGRHGDLSNTSLLFVCRASERATLIINILLLLLRQTDSSTRSILGSSS